MAVEVRAVVISARIGAGHDGAAAEVARRLRARGFAIDRHDYLDLLPGRLGQRLCDAYHRELEIAPGSWDWLLGALGRPPLAGMAKAASRLASPRLREVLDPMPDLVVSTYPLASQALGALRRRGELTAPLAVYLTDPSVHRLVVTEHADLHLAPNRHAAQAARRLGAPRVVVARPVVAPGFRPALPGERDRARRRFGLAGQERFALVVAGSWGVGEVEGITADVAATGAAQPVVVCGRNDALAQRLRRAGVPRVLGWVDDMPALLRACDVVVQNAGGLTTLEALASGLPVITYRSLPGHGRANARVLDEIGLVPAVPDAGALADALRSARSPGLPDGVDPAELLAALVGEAVEEVSAA
ncbi:glycosyltransferase [Amycolatopsis alkalitolerans]|uniref:Glycosyltransferase n=1 Tax=Amycolatopsis alkalitolerans TaxID=2547244 RepID=A0A5C4M1P4_9PSEU|nr:glycosyltransferase [Amycolatopsis alkalitolerans]TNC25847.1 glycosyltransferase [Amycolatopsis alkalitolerans]